MFLPVKVKAFKIFFYLKLPNNWDYFFNTGVVNIPIKDAVDTFEKQGIFIFCLAGAEFKVKSFKSLDWVKIGV